MLVHATTVVIDKQAVMLAGPPGSGKSDLALRLIDEGAALLADDQTFLRKTAKALIASPPPVTAGLFEIRHLGLVRMPCKAKAKVALYVELGDLAAELERLPEPEVIFLLDHATRKLRLPGMAASTPAKIRAALKYPLHPG